MTDFCIRIEPGSKPFNWLVKNTPTPAPADMDEFDVHVESGTRPPALPHILSVVRGKPRCQSIVFHLAGLDGSGRLATVARSTDCVNMQDSDGWWDMFSPFPFHVV